MREAYFWCKTYYHSYLLKNVEILGFVNYRLKLHVKNSKIGYSWLFEIIIGY